MVAFQALSVHPNRQTTATDHLPLSATCRRHHADEGRVVVSMSILGRQHVPLAVALHSIIYPHRRSLRLKTSHSRSRRTVIFIPKTAVVTSTKTRCDPAAKVYPKNNTNLTMGLDLLHYRLWTLVLKQCRRRSCILQCTLENCQEQSNIERSWETR